MSDDCLFCKIVAGEIPSAEVLSTESAYAFRDIDPKAPTHVLVVPRQHVTDASHLDGSHGELLVGVFEAARLVAEQEGLTATSGGNGYRLVMNVGDDAGNTVPHLHVHVVGGRKLTWPPG
jgi:histidine triad (HIT) family protein